MINKKITFLYKKYKIMPNTHHYNLKMIKTQIN